MLTPEEMDALLQESNGYAAELGELPDGVVGPKVNEYLNAPAPQEAPPEPEEAPESDDLDQFVSEQAESAPVEPEQEPVVSPITKQWYADLAPSKDPRKTVGVTDPVTGEKRWVTPEEDAALEKQAMSEEQRSNPVVAQTDGQQAQLVSTKPQWYDDLAPPKIDGAKEAASGLFGGLLNAFTAPSAKEGMGAFFKGVGKAADGALAAPQQNYANRLNAADKQADMHAKLNSGGRNSASLDLAERKFQHLLDKEQTAAATEKALKTIGSPESNELVDAYISAGIFPPDAKKTTSAWQMKQGRVGAQQQAGAERGQVNWKDRHNIGTDTKVELKNLDNAEYDRRHEITEGAKIEGEEREQEVGRQKAGIKGWQANTEQAVDTATQHEARKMAGQIDRAVRSARKLRELQEKINFVTQAGGDWFKVFGKDENQKKILSRMQVLQNQLGAAQRDIFHQGVPQQFEMTLNARTNPNADSAMTFFTGANNWEAMEDIMSEQGAAEMGYLGYDPDGGVALAPKPSAPREHKSLSGEMKKAAPVSREIARGAVDAGKQAISGAVGTVKEAVSGKGDNDPNAILGQFEVELPNGKKILRELTQKAYEKAEALGYPITPVGK